MTSPGAYHTVHVLEAGIVHALIQLRPHTSLYRQHKMLSRLTTCARSLAPAVSSNFQSVLRPFATSAPSIYDFLIRFHIIDKTGKRHTLQGLSGCSLAQAIFESGVLDSVNQRCNFTSKRCCILSTLFCREIH